MYEKLKSFELNKNFVFEELLDQMRSVNFTYSPTTIIIIAIDNEGIFFKIIDEEEYSKNYNSSSDFDENNEIIRNEEHIFKFKKKYIKDEEYLKYIFRWIHIRLIRESKILLSTNPENV